MKTKTSKSTAKRFLCLLLTLCMMVIPFPVTASAALSDGIVIPYRPKMTLTLYSPTSTISSRSNITVIPDVLDGACTKVKVTTSNSRIVAVQSMMKVYPETTDHNGYTTGDWPASAKVYELSLRLKRVGTAKITIAGTLKGKRITKTITIKVVKYQNPFSSLKVNGTEYKSKYNNAPGIITIKCGSSYSYNYRVKSGWTVKSHTKLESSKYTTIRLKIYNAAAKRTETYDIRLKK